MQVRQDGSVSKRSPGVSRLPNSSKDPMAIILCRLPELKKE